MRDAGLARQPKGVDREALMPRYQKHFSLAEARALIPSLRQAFHDMHHRRDRVEKADEKLAALLKKTTGDVGGTVVNGLMMDLLQLNTQLRLLHEWGVVVKDLDRGLLDFPHMRDAQEVFLCWELDEDDIEFWHELDGGYQNRERL
jgi:hypothetical protein